MGLHLQIVLAAPEQRFHVILYFDHAYQMYLLMAVGKALLPW